MYSSTEHVHKQYMYVLYTFCILCIVDVEYTYYLTLIVENVLLMYIDLDCGCWLDHHNHMYTYMIDDVVVCTLTFLY